MQALEQRLQAEEKGLQLGASRIVDLLDWRRRPLRARADQAKACYDLVRNVVALRIRGGDIRDADTDVWAVG